MISVVYIIFLGALAIAQIYITRGVTDSIEKAEVSGRIAQKLSVLNMLTQDYLLQKTERAKMQWQTTYKAVENLIEHNFAPHENIGHDHSRQEEEILQELHADHQFIGEQFNRIIHPGISKNVLEKLAFQAVLRSQVMARKAFGLSDAATRSVLHTQQINRVLNLILLPAMFLLVLFGFYFLVFPALKSLKKISKGAEFIGKGNFSHRIDIPSRDEVGDLAAAFNGMSDNLEKITASRDALNKEVAERKLAQTSLKNSEERLKEANRELLRSNQELMQFAYVASHDLQEPLRMVSSYTQLLEKRYGHKLDQDALDFIDYAVDGANRMQRLIQDLLIYSRITTRGDNFSSVDVHDAVGNALKNLQTLIQEKKGLVSVDELPVIMGDYSQIIQLFQNLIGNALKFCRPEQPPRVHISATMNADHFGFRTFSVTDNGIGIDDKHFDRIFVIFQRLHGRQEYSGTGIGLALCKSIVERHGGKIWLTSSVEEGTVFYFTLPAVNEKKEHLDEYATES